MNENNKTTNTAFSRSIKDFGIIHLRHFDMEQDMSTIYDWITKPYALYWGMMDKSIEEVKYEYTELLSRRDYEVFVGMYEDKPIFLMEKYKAQTDRISEYFEAKDTDYGMHVLVAPPEKRIHGFTWHVFTTILEYFFCAEGVKRIVVEPDVRNKKIHELNKKAGFIYQKEIELPEKKAMLAFCERKDYEIRKNLSIPMIKSKKDFLFKGIWEKVNRALIRKAISEFSHELILAPMKKEDGNKDNVYHLASDIPNVTYEFTAKRQALDHWHIDEESIVKKNGGNVEEMDALKFIVEFRHSLGIPKNLIPTYLEEISSTLSSAAYKCTNQQFSAKELVKESFQNIEHAMVEGHPGFVANNGRIGFNGEDYAKYAPETNRPFSMLWLAGHKDKATFTGISKYGYKSLLTEELGKETMERFHLKLETLGVDPESYVFIPVHPWQWNNKIIQVFASDIATQKLVFLEEGEDRYSAQQSIRTLFNASDPSKMYVKTALSILNMGFMRGLSPYYMQSTPHITSWITALLSEDDYLRQKGFSMLGEVATVGFENTYYEILGKTNAYNKMLSALWRESPHARIKEGQQLMTMAAFLHVDGEGASMLVELIKESPHNVEAWLRQYLQAYLSPILHCFYNYGLVFMPHGENIIMVMENQTPVGIFMKDITEEVIVFNSELDLPEHARRLYVETSDEMKVLSIFTDVFDGIFRYMSSILENHDVCSEASFWKEVAECIHSYQSNHPELESKFETYDLFVSEFDRCCLNRLQLKNTKQMLNLGNPMESLILEGVLQNPIAVYGRSKGKNGKQGKGKQQVASSTT